MKISQVGKVGLPPLDFLLSTFEFPQQSQVIKS